ncbi:MAG: hypothetical protein U1C74_18305 [Phenylobacterium sp.]|nr:hypothetical protein [Phenylobacterium sp.]
MDPVPTQFRLWGRSSGPHPCGNPGASLKPTARNSGGPMSGVYMILVFIGVLAVLNKFEFGRFD